MRQDKRYQRENEIDCGKGDRVGGFDGEKHSCQRARAEDCSDNADDHTRQNGSHTAVEDMAHNRLSVCAECHADADLFCSVRDKKSARVPLTPTLVMNRATAANSPSSTAVTRGVPSNDSRICASVSRFIERGEGCRTPERCPAVLCRADRICDFAVFDLFLAVDAVWRPRHRLKAFGADGVAALQALAVAALVNAL